MHPRSRELLLCPGGVTVLDGHPIMRNVVPSSSCTIILPAATGSSAVLGQFWGDTLVAGAPWAACQLLPGTSGTSSSAGCLGLPAQIPA